MPNAPQLILPSVDQGISQVTWLAFIRRWEAFKIGSNISNQNACTQLFYLTDKSLLISSLSNEVCHSKAVIWEYPGVLKKV